MCSFFLTARTSSLHKKSQELQGACLNGTSLPVFIRIDSIGTGYIDNVDQISNQIKYLFD